MKTDRKETETKVAEMNLVRKKEEIGPERDDIKSMTFDGR
jgi:hypothetical protein